MLRNYFLVFLFLFSCVFFVKSCQKPSSILEKALSNPDPLIQNVLNQKEKHEIQILLTHVHKKKNGKGSFQEESFQLDEGRYFYPASTAKLPIAILTLQKISALQSQGTYKNKQQNRY